MRDLDDQDERGMRGGDVTTEPDPIDVLTEAWEAKTPGPWVFATDEGAPQYVQLYSTAAICDYEADVLSAAECDVLVSEPDATFIALCGTHVGTLLARLKAAEAVCEALTRLALDEIGGPGEPLVPVEQAAVDALDAWRAVKGERDV